MCIELDEKVLSQVNLGDGKLQNVEDKGVLVVYTKRGNRKFVIDVPGLTQNLLSVGQLFQKGYLINFDNGSCIISDKKNNQTVAKV